MENEENIVVEDNTEETVAEETVEAAEEKVIEETAEEATEEAEEAAEETAEEETEEAEEATEEAAEETEESTEETEEAETEESEEGSALDDAVSQVKKSKVTIIALVIVLVCVVIAAVLIILGINKKNKAAEAEKAAQATAQTATPAKNPAAATPAVTDKYDIVANLEVEGIKVGLAQYKDITLKAKKGVVPEEQFNEALASLAETFLAYNEVTDGRECKKNDQVSIDYVGMIDGVAFAGGTGSTDTLVLGSGQMISGFEDGIIGHKTGEEFDVEATFPENYGKEELNGKTAVFHITLKKISESYTPELTDEVVAANTEYKTVDELKQFVRDYLQGAADNTELNTVKGQFWQNLIDSCTFEGDMSALNARYEEELINYTLQSQGDSPKNIMMNYYGYSEAEADAYIQEQVLKTTKQELILKAIIANEGMTIDEDEFNNYIAGYMSYVKAQTKEEFFDMIGGDETFFREDFMQNKAYDFVDESMNIIVE